MPDLLDLDTLVADAEALAAKAKRTRERVTLPASSAWREDRTYVQFTPTTLVLVRTLARCSECGQEHARELELWVESVAKGASKRTRITRPTELETYGPAKLTRRTIDEVVPVPFCANCATFLFYKEMPDDQPYNPAT